MNDLIHDSSTSRGAGFGSAKLTSFQSESLHIPAERISDVSHLTSDIAISVSCISKYFDKECVLKNVTRDFEKGKIHGIVGNNGSGKTVLMKCICGFLIPDEGKLS